MLSVTPFDVRPALWRVLAGSPPEDEVGTLAPGGLLYLEDYYARRPLVDEAELAALETQVGCPAPRRLPTREAFEAQLLEAGFEDVAFTDATTRWAPWVAKRAAAWSENLPRHRRVHGDAVAGSMGTFYDTTASLLAGGHPGGCIITARRPH